MPFNYQSGNRGTPGPSGGNQQFASALMQLLSQMNDPKSSTGTAPVAAVTPPASNTVAGATSGAMGNGFQTQQPTDSKMSY